MAATADDIQRRNAGTPISEAIFDELRAEVLGGALAAGDALPSERRLAERFEVNRHAIREAVKRLQQAGLVQVSHGGATRVLDWRRHGGLDLLAQLPLTGALAAGDVVAILELRRCIGVDVARCCAERAPAELHADLRTHAEALAALPSDDLDQRELAYAALWSAIVDGAQNVAYRLGLNSLVTGIAAQREAFLPLLAGELRDPRGHAALLDALLQRDPGGAVAAADHLLTRTVAAATAAAPGGPSWSS